MKRISASLISLSLLPLTSMAWDTPTMGGGYSSDELVDVYSPEGICIARSIRRSEMSTLPAGIYIAGGEKIIVKPIR